MKCSVIDQRPVSREIFRLWVEADGPCPWTPGQFFHIRVGEGTDHVLRRPISLCEGVDDRRFCLVYRVVGAGTRWLARRRPGDVLDVLGPLGRGFPLHPGDRRVLLVGGGVGVPPLVELAKRLCAQGAEVLSVVGFRNAEDVMLVDELGKSGPVWVVTEDGSAGRRGLVTDVVQEALQKPTDRFYACGPMPMLRALQERLGDRLPGYVSLEERMGCGIGVCMGCVHLCRTPQGVWYRRVCTEGPVFPAGEVVFS
ncbi:MAG: dihydroorotate dehydrogenase electron transfer subunit [Alicyclobacillaceae bacterium]|nr:dihydroorotate dehydrogenase electron transfer subunit [Alicyclobacillaceae bacterium]